MLAPEWRVIGLLLPLTALLNFGCHPSRGEDSSTNSVVYKGRLWSNPKAIPVCIVNSSEVDAALLDDIKNHTVQDFSSKAGIQLVGWNPCTDQEMRSEAIRVHFSRVHDWSDGGRSVSGGGGLSILGPSTSSCSGCAGGTMQLNIGQQGRYPSVSNQFKYNYAVKFTRATAIHEFGHALGLNHEHERTDAPQCKNEMERNPQGQATVYVGSYDPDSIMNYCHNENLTVLSSGDAAGLAFLYPNLKGTGQTAPAEPNDNKPTPTPPPSSTPTPKPGSTKLCDANIQTAGTIGRTERTGAQTTLAFQNSCPQDIQVFWINGAGESVPYGVIAAGGKLRMRTYMDHAWQFRNADNVVVKELKIAPWMQSVTLP